MANETLVKSEPKQQLAPMWPDFMHFRNEMQQMMSNMFARPFGSWLEMPEMPSMRPALNLFQQDGKLVAELSVPGMEKKDIKINVSDHLLTVEGEFKKEEKVQKERSYMEERYTGKFSRSVRLPAEVKSREVNAELKEGILRITMPLADPKSHEVSQIQRLQARMQVGQQPVQRAHGDRAQEAAHAGGKPDRQAELPGDHHGRLEQGPEAGCHHHAGSESERPVQPPLPGFSCQEDDQSAQSGEGPGEQSGGEGHQNHWTHGGL